MNENEKKISGIIWNSIGGGLVAFQSAILLFLAARFYNQETAGIISIGYAIAVFIYTFGRYGMRNYQATDVINRYSFRDYLKSRYVSIAISITILITYLFFSTSQNGYSIEKCIIVFEIVIFRMVYSFEDVFCGHLQKIDRFTEGARIMTIREGIAFCTVMLLMVLRVNLVLVFLAGIFASISADAILLYRIKPIFKENLDSDSSTGQVASLLKECFPLALGTSLAIYLSNIPKYVTDWYMDDSMQAIIGYLILPVFTIALLNQFIYNPFIRDLGELYYNDRRSAFYKRVFKQVAVIIATTAVLGLIIYFAGIPILSVLFKTDLSLYRVELVVLIIGGFFYALQYYLAIPVTVMKRQNYMLPGYIGAIAVCFLVQKELVEYMGLKGVAGMYVIANGIMALYLLILLYKRESKTTEKGVV